MFDHLNRCQPASILTLIDAFINGNYFITKTHAKDAFRAKRIEIETVEVLIVRTIAVDAHKYVAAVHHF